MTTQRGHQRFIGGKVYCPRAERRVSLGGEHVYGSEFVCPGCGVRIDATKHFAENPPRRSVQITCVSQVLLEGTGEPG